MSEAKRLEVLRASKLLDVGAEERFDRITRLAANSLEADMALITLIEEDEQIFKSTHGLDSNGTPRDISFCHHAIQSNDIMVVKDTKQDSKFRKNPLVLGEPHIGFYAGVPLITKEGYALGTLCIIDRSSRPEFDKTDQQILADLGAMVMSEIESVEQDQLIDDLTLINEELRHRMGNMYAHVSALVSLIGRDEEDKDRLVRRLRKKINMLAETQNLLSNYNWQSVPLSALIATTLRQFVVAAEDNRVMVQSEGDFEISPRGAFTLSLMLNELGTNAVKHGALGVPNGTVSFGWVNSGDELRFTWQEVLKGTRASKNPGVGFGSKILNRIVPMDLQGSVTYDLTDTGLIYTVTAKADRVKYISDTG